MSYPYQYYTEATVMGAISVKCVCYIFSCIKSITLQICNRCCSARKETACLNFFSDYRHYTRAVPGESAMWWTLKSSLQESHIRTTSSLSIDTASPLSTSTRAVLGRFSQVGEGFLNHKIIGQIIEKDLIQMGHSNIGCCLMFSKLNNKFTKYFNNFGVLTFYCIFWTTRHT